jgi:hypothetical protein
MKPKWIAKISIKVLKAEIAFLEKNLKALILCYKIFIKIVNQSLNKYIRNILMLSKD